MTVSFAVIEKALTVASESLGDPLARIEAQRVEEREKLATAERDMLQHAASDSNSFAEAKGRREAAQLALEQLDWAERAEHQRREQAERDAKMAQLREQQQAAQNAHVRGAALAIEAHRHLGNLCDALRSMRECQAAVDKGVHFEQFAVSAGQIPRATVRPRLTIDPDAAVLALRAAKEYLRLAQVAEAVGEMRAVQSKL